MCSIFNLMVSYRKESNLLFILSVINKLSTYDRAKRSSYSFKPKKNFSKVITLDWTVLKFMTNKVDYISKNPAINQPLLALAE